MHVNEIPNTYPRSFNEKKPKPVKYFIETAYFRVSVISLSLSLYFHLLLCLRVKYCSIEFNPIVPAYWHRMIRFIRIRTTHFIPTEFSRQNFLLFLRLLERENSIWETATIQILSVSRKLKYKTTLTALK